MNRARKTELTYHTAPVQHQLTDNAGPENVGPSVRGWKMQQDQHFMNSSYSVVFGHGNTLILLAVNCASLMTSGVPRRHSNRRSGLATLLSVGAIP